MRQLIAALTAYSKSSWPTDVALLPAPIESSLSLSVCSVHLPAKAPKIAQNLKLHFCYLFSCYNKPWRIQPSRLRSPLPNYFVRIWTDRDLPGASNAITHPPPRPCPSFVLCHRNFRVPAFRVWTFRRPWFIESSLWPIPVPYSHHVVSIVPTN
jgi:hypothetical protein